MRCRASITRRSHHSVADPFERHTRAQSVVDTTSPHILSYVGFTRRLSGRSQIPSQTLPDATVEDIISRCLHNNNNTNNNLPFTNMCVLFPGTVACCLPGRRQEPSFWSTVCCVRKAQHSEILKFQDSRPSPPPPPIETYSPRGWAWLFSLLEQMPRH